MTYRVQSKEKKHCAVPTCVKLANRKGYCDMHYSRWKKGMPMEGRVRKRAWPDFVLD